MDTHVDVTQTSEIAAAVDLAERYAASRPKDSGVKVCPLICEELLLRLLNRGCSEIRVPVRGFFPKHIEIRAKGERVDALGPAAKTEEDGIAAQISDCLLDQYADYFSYRYQNGVNLYRVFAGKRAVADMTGEIYDFYENADSGNPHKPMAVLWHIVRNHRGFFSLAIFILLMKHLAALMLPVFVANIINTVTQTSSFFVWPVMANILMSIVALIANLFCFWLDTLCYRRFARAVEAGFRMALVQKLQALSMRFHRGSQSGVVLSKLVSDVQFIEMLIYDRFVEILYLCEDALFIIGVALTAFPLMLAFYIVIIPAFVFLLRHFSRLLQDKRALMRRENEQANAAVKEMLEMESLTRAHGLKRAEYRNILSKVRGAQRASVLYDRQTVSVNGSPSRGRSFGTPGSYCWTRPPAPLTASASGRCRRPSTP